MPALSAHFTEEELNKGGAVLPVNVRANLATLARDLLEPVREILGVPMLASGYRDFSRNAAVGGTEKSQHLDGTAADFTPRGLSLYETAQRIDTAIRESRMPPFGQLIYYPYTTGHIHISLPTRGKYGEILVKLGGESGGYARFDLATFPRWKRQRKRGTGWRTL